MKNNILLMAMLSLSITACKKESKEIESEEETAIVEETQSTIKSINNDEIVKILTSKDNDTLYITNFFATWCGPCVREMPHFSEQMILLKDKPVKFTFVSVDDPGKETTVKNFASQFKIDKNVVMLDARQLPEDFFTKNFKTWDGASIPFTLIVKRDKRKEIIGMISKEKLEETIKTLQ